MNEARRTTRNNRDQPWHRGLLALASVSALLGLPGCEAARPEGLPFVPDFRPPCALGGIRFGSSAPLDLRLGEATTVAGEIGAPQDLGEPGRKCQAQTDGHTFFPFLAAAWTQSGAVDVAIVSCPCTAGPLGLATGMRYLPAQAAGGGRVLLRVTATAPGSAQLVLAGHVRDHCADPAATVATCGLPASASVLVRVRP